MAIEQTDYEAAETYFKQALTGLQQTVGSNHPDIGYTYWCLGAAYHWQDKFKEAAKCYREALNIKEQQLGRKHEDLLNIIEPLIEVSKKLRRIDEVDQLNHWVNEITSYRQPG
jgi:Tetratricopeptide repeat.